MNELITTLRERTLNDLENLEMLLEKYKTEHPVIIKLLNLPEQALYSLTKAHKGNLDSVYGLVHSLRHAFVDDGDWSLVRRVNTDIMEMFEQLNHEPEEIAYTYSIEMGDWMCSEGVEAILIHECDWDAIIDTYMLHIDYYEEHGDAIEDFETKEHERYWELLRKSEELYSDMFKAWQKVEDDWKAKHGDL